MANKKIIAKRFKLVKKLGNGAFGQVFLAEDLKEGGEVAVKMEKSRGRYPQLHYESKIYKVLAGGEGITRHIWYGTESRYNVFVTDRLGLSLEKHFERNNKRLDVQTTLFCGEQMVKRIRFMHSRHFVHRDIKPDNFMSGRGDKSDLVYVIDFGLSKRFRHPKTRKHISYKEGKNLTGTPRYASINNHMGVEQSRRDDMESIGYVLIYFVKGRLPWQGLKANAKRQKYKKIMDKKMSTDLEDLCEGVPECLKKFLQYSRSLRFTDKPNYGYLQNLFTDSLKELFGEGPYKPYWYKSTAMSTVSVASSSHRINSTPHDLSPRHVSSMRVEGRRMRSARSDPSEGGPPPKPTSPMRSERMQNTLRSLGVIVSDNEPSELVE